MAQHNFQTPNAGANDGQDFYAHFRTVLQEERVADLSEDVLGEDIVARTVIWLPAPFAILIAHGIWPTLVV